MRRSLIGLIGVPVIGLLLLPVASNVAADTLPEAWRPYLWVAWPVGVILAAPMIYGEIRDRAHRQRVHPGTVDVQQKRLHAAAHDLAKAVHRQWMKEAGVRSLRSPKPIRVSWSSIGLPVAAEISRVLAENDVAGRTVRLRGDIGRVAEVFRHVRTRQLVILGEPAAGKSVTALLLTLDLPPDEPVPVLLTVSSWNPHKEDLHVWVARRIVEEYPALGNSDVYGIDVTTRLVTEKRVLPVLDGLDEMSTDLQPLAIKSIERTVTDQYPLVVTCRTDEYHKAIDKNGRFLAHAAVLEIAPVEIEDAADFLCGANPRPEHWQGVLNHLRANPDGPPARALRSPLMIDLARTVYATSTRNPAELLDTARFPDQSTVEHHLLNAFLVVAYEDRPAQPGSALIRYSLERASKWLRFLATAPKAAGDPDLAWWQLEHSVPRLTRGTVAGLVTGLVFGLTEGYLYGPTIGLIFALVFGLATGFAAHYGHPRKPSRIKIRFHGNGQSLLRRLAASLAIGLIVSSVADPATGIVHMSVVMIILTAHLWLDTPPDLTTASSPMDVLEQDRRAALTLGAVLALGFASITTASMTVAPVDGLAVGMMSGLISILLNAALGTILGGFLYRRPGAIAYGIAGAVVGALAGDSSHEPMHWTFALASGVGYGLKIGCLGVLSRAWGTFAFTRLWLALTGRLPLRLMRFLDDAHRRGVLRQSGTVYQFRHEHLRDHLAADQPRASAVIT